MENEFSNYSYDGDKWYDFTPENHTTHTSGQIITADVVSASATNLNFYTAKTN